MEARNQRQHQQPNLSSPSPLPSSSLLRDISNFRTPRHPSQNANVPSSPYPQTHSKFFTASKNTPISASSCRGRPKRIATAAQSNAARRLKAFELEQSKSARKAQIDKEKSLKSLAKSLTVWLNFLFENPKSCGCDVSTFSGEFEPIGEGAVEEPEGLKKKRGNRPGHGVKVEVDGPWRGPKRQRNLTWRKGLGSGETISMLSDSIYLSLNASLVEVCSFHDLKERMRAYLSLESCKDIFDTMTQVTKNIDEGRLKMRPHCPMVADVGIKERSMRILMSYSPIWLRIGLYIVLGGDSLLPDGDVNSEQEMVFLRMVIEKQFFSHSELAKTFAYNKLVDGLYRPGYYEKLGAVILKRFLLLVLILDRAKYQSSLPLKYGIDGLDGGSPLLFSLQSNIKSSCQLINEFLSSDVMHGEGDLLAHLMIVGYKVSYQQSPLVEYNFRVMDLFEDLQDGVRLCRAIQLLQNDSSILLKMVVPSDTHKKRLVNCGIALQYLKQAGASLCDEDGMLIMEEDVTNREKELVLSLLWNMFVQLQLPLLMNKRLLSEEISKIRGVVSKHSSTCSILDMLLGWIQAVGESSDLKIENFSSLTDGKAMWCLLDYYFRKDLDETNGAVSLVSTTEYADALHNFILSQKLTSLLGNFPEVIQVSDILEHNGASNERSVVILLVFLSFQLLVKRNTDQLNFHKLLGFNCISPERKRSSNERWFLHPPALSNAENELRDNSADASAKFKAIMAWWQDMAHRNNKRNSMVSTLNTRQFLPSSRSCSIQRANAAKIIQSHFRRLVENRRFMIIKKAALLLQTAIRAWLFVKSKSSINQFGASKNWKLSCAILKHSENSGKHMMAFMVDRHAFVKLKRSVKVIQDAVRDWISRRHHMPRMLFQDLSNDDPINAAIVVQKCFRGWKTRTVLANMIAQVEIDPIVSKEDELTDLHTKAAVTIQKAWREFTACRSCQKQHLAATKIQSHLRSLLIRKSFINLKEAILKIQSIFKGLRCRQVFQCYRQERISALLIQSHVRGWIVRRCIYRLRYHVLIIQSHFRGWLIRKKLSLQKEAALRIQTAFRCMNQQKAFLYQKLAAIEIQRFIRGQITRKELQGASCFRDISNDSCNEKLISSAILRLQRWWKSVLLLKMKTRSAIVIQSHFRGRIARQKVAREKQRAIFIQSHFRGWISRQKVARERQQAIVIQSHFRGWIARQKVTRERKRIAVIQAYWKGYLTRKDSRGKLLELRLRVQKSAANVDDSMRLINRLIAAVSELLSMRSISGILHTCATLDMATEHSQRCCEELVAAGAVSTLLKLISSVSRSIPDQEVLKHALSILRNLARYPHLMEVLIETNGGIKIILWELIRNKEEGYFIACELLKKICLNRKGVEAVHKLPALLKRLHDLVEDLSKKAANEKRSNRALVTREQVDRRLREAVQLLEMIKNA